MGLLARSKHDQENLIFFLQSILQSKILQSMSFMAWAKIKPVLISLCFRCSNHILTNNKDQISQPIAIRQKC